MPDPRFFESRGPFRLGELAELAGAVLSRPDKADTLIDTAGPLTRVGAAGISFFADRRYRQELRDTAAGACFLREAESQHAPEGCVSLFTNEPHAAYAMVADQLHPVRRWTPHDQIHPSAVLEEGVGLAPGVVIGPGAQVGRGTVLGPYAVIGPGVCIGRDCVIGAQVSIGFALIGDRVKVMAGAVIGEPGFGVTTSEGKALDVPQLGRVIIQDGVSVGAGTCIDRGAWDDTVIGERTKIDNLVQIAHNVRLGRNCLLAAHTGISGSCDIGDGVAFGGRAGIADHIRIGDGARIAAAAGVMKDVPAGEMWVGSPARPIRRFMRETAWLAKMAKTRAEGPEE